MSNQDPSDRQTPNGSQNMKPAGRSEVWESLDEPGRQLMSELNKAFSITFIDGEIKGEAQ